LVPQSGLVFSSALSCKPDSRALKGEKPYITGIMLLTPPQGPSNNNNNSKHSTQRPLSTLASRSYLTFFLLFHKPSIFNFIMDVFQHITESHGALHSPCGEAPQQRRPLTPQHALIGFTPTPTHPSALHTRARPNLPSRHRSHAQRSRSRAHFTPQHWLLCHLGLYQFEFY